MQRNTSQWQNGKTCWAGILLFSLIPWVAWAVEGGTDHQKRQPKAPPLEIVAACNGLAENAPCEVQTPQGIFKGTCQNLQGQSACVLRKQDAPAELIPQWESRDRNHDGFLDVNEIHGDRNGPERRKKAENPGATNERHAVAPSMPAQ